MGKGIEENRPHIAKETDSDELSERRKNKIILLNQIKKEDNDISNMKQNYDHFENKNGTSTKFNHESIESKNEIKTTIDKNIIPDQTNQIDTHHTNKFQNITEEFI